MTISKSNISYRCALILRPASVLILAACAFWPLQRSQVNQTKIVALANSLSDLRGQAAVEHLKQQGLYDTLAEAVAAARYNADALSSGDAYQFSNPAQSLRATFTSSGARVVSSPGGRNRELTFKLIGYGYGSRMTGLESQNIVASRNRIEHEYSLQKESAIPESQSAIKEWFVNSEAGIEHGFTLPEPPPAERCGDEALRVEMEIGGDFEPRLDAAGQVVTLDCGCGAGGLTYDKLRVYDAREREVAARFELEGKRLAIVMEDGEAEYPLTIDPQLAQESKLMASDGAAGDSFGSSVAISGDSVVVGAPAANVNETTLGAAYIFVRVATTWVQQAKLTAMNSAAFGLFGRSVAIDGNTVVVGAPLGPFDIDLGTAYVFERSGTTWTQQAILTPRSGEFFVTFGVSVAIDGDTVVVGADFENTGNQNFGKGAAYVFTRNGTTWPDQAKLMASDGAVLDLFGSSVAIAGDTLVVGAIGADIDTKESQGAAYIFARSGTTWSQQAKLIASDGASNDFFGSSVAISGDTVAVGAPLDDSSKGSTYVFTGSGTNWTQQQKLTASDGASGAFFGSSVALSGDTVMVGAPDADIAPNINQGAAYVFARSGTTWSLQQKLTASDGSSDALFGASVAISGDTKVAGASGANSNQGSAYVFMTPIAPGAFVTVSAASYTSPVAPKEIVAGFGASLAATIAFAGSLPLPTVLGEMSVIVEDSAGDERLAPLYFVSPSQFNYQIPDGAATGVAKVSVLIGLDLVAVGFVQIATTAPSIFTLNASGSGPAAALDALTFAPAPFNAKQPNGTPNFIAVWGTGLGMDATDSGGDVSSSVVASIDGVQVEVTYAGPTEFQGVNQFNIQLPAVITPGAHMLTISRNNMTSNIVTIAIK